MDNQEKYLLGIMLLVLIITLIWFVARLVQNG